MNCDELAATWAQRWPRPSPSTDRQNGYMVRKFGRDFAGRSLESVSRSEARAWALENAHSARWVRAMFNDALDEGLVTANPFAEMRIPRKPAKKITVPTPRQIAKLVEIDPEETGHRIIFAAETGLRFSEQLALTTTDFTHGLSRCLVERQLGRGEKMMPTKTHNSIRTVFVSAAAQDAVRESLDGRLSGRVWPTGKNVYRREWTEVREEAGVWIRWHDLRHYAATRMLDAGATVDDVAVQLGCDVEMVRRRYGHPDHEKALARLERLTDG